jgi:predicted molibdopterin-dependent oxidoreductase YjgC
VFRRTQPPEADPVTVSVEGTPVCVAAGESVAAAVLASGLVYTRESALSGAPRGPWCMMGVCFECLVEIDGEANHQACLTPVREGMQIRCQRGARVIAP